MSQEHVTWSESGGVARGRPRRWLETGIPRSNGSRRCPAGGGPELVYRGHEGLRRYWDDWHSVWDVTIDVEEMRDLGETVLAHRSCPGTRRGKRNRPRRPDCSRLRVRGWPDPAGARLPRPAAGTRRGRAFQARSIGSAAVTQRIVLLPGDGIGPEIMASARELLAAVGDFDIEEQLVGGASIDANGSPLTDEVLAACRGADAVLLAAVGGPKWDTTDPDAPRPEQGLLGLRKELGPVREPAAGAPEPRAARRQPAQARPHRGHRPARGARAHRRHLLRRARPERRHRVRHLRLQRGRDRAHRPRGVPAGAAEGHERGQGEHPRDLAPVAEDRGAGGRGRGHAAGAHARGQRRHAAGLAPVGVRRAPHREHVRGHPERRGRDAHGLARDAPERLARRIRPRPVRAGARLGARTSRAPARRIRSPCSAPWR